MAFGRTGDGSTDNPDRLALVIYHHDAVLVAVGLNAFKRRGQGVIRRDHADIFAGQISNLDQIQAFQGAIFAQERFDEFVLRRRQQFIGR